MIYLFILSLISSLCATSVDTNPYQAAALGDVRKRIVISFPESQQSAFVEYRKRQPASEYCDVKRLALYVGMSCVVGASAVIGGIPGALVSLWATGVIGCVDFGGALFSPPSVRRYMSDAA